MSELSELSSLLSFLAANRGISLRDAARATGLRVDQICRRLEVLSFCGVPPYSPHDYVSYRLVGHGDDAVIDLQYAQHFARPLNFTPGEALALKYALEHFAGGADEESVGLLAELQEMLANALHGRARELMARTGRGFVVPRKAKVMREMLQTLQDAIDRRRACELEYFSSHRARLSSRRVYPFQVVEHDAAFYLYGWCETAQATRHFRLERIREVRVTDQRYDRRPPPSRKSGRMAGLFEGKPGDSLQVRFAPEVAREVQNDWASAPGAKVQAGRDGSLLLTLPLYNPHWAVGYVASFGPFARIVQPRWLSAELAATVRSILQSHKQG